MLKRIVLLLILTAALAPLPAVWAQASPSGEQLFTQHCAKCHDLKPNSDRETLRQFAPEGIYEVLTTGLMVPLATAMNDAQKREVAEFAAGRPMGSAPSGDATAMKNHCASELLGDPFKGPAWNGWGVDLDNSRFQPAAAAGLTAEQAPHLKLKWAFGFPNAVWLYNQPTVVGGRIYVGANTGFVYALNAKSGCVYWSFKAQGGVRSAITVGPAIKGSRPARYPLYFGDMKANVYAVDAATGKLLWTQRADTFPSARIVGAPKLVEGRLYAPVASWAGMELYGSGFECCKFRGSVVAYDAASGHQIWKSYMVPQEPRPTKKTKTGGQLWGPSGAGTWASPTIDLKRRVLYATTGNGYSGPAGETMDAVVAFDLATGKMLWSHQLTPNDAIDVEGAPDFDIGSSVILRTLPGGRSILVVSSKSGVTYGLDPDHQGKQLWEHRTGKGGESGGTMWGSAADEQLVYVANSDSQYGPAEAGGLFALRLASGEDVWHWRPPVPPDCKPKEASCVPAQSAAVTVIPGVVFSATKDGTMRAFSAADGRVLWEFKTMRESFKTVNGVPAHGGSIDGPGPTVVGGMLFMTSGYGLARGKGVAGNVLLAFDVE